MNGRSRRRLGYAGLLTVGLVGLLAVTGGLIYPASSHASARAGSCSQYAVAPGIAGMTPTSGKAGTTVTIIGNHFEGDNVITSVKFAGGVTAAFHINSKSKLSTTVPKTATTGGITVANCAGHATTAKFTVLSSCVVPKVVGKSLGAAKKAIAKAHCTSGSVKKASSTKKKNTVIKQSPKPGAKPKNGKVSLTVSKG